MEFQIWISQLATVCLGMVWQENWSERLASDGCMVSDLAASITIKQMINLLSNGFIFNCLGLALMFKINA